MKIRLKRTKEKKLSQSFFLHHPMMRTNSCYMHAAKSETYRMALAWTRDSVSNKAGWDWTLPKNSNIKAVLWKICFWKSYKKVLRMSQSSVRLNLWSVLSISLSLTGTPCFLLIFQCLRCQYYPFIINNQIRFSGRKISVRLEIDVNDDWSYRNGLEES